MTRLLRVGLILLPIAACEVPPPPSPPSGEPAPAPASAVPTTSPASVLDQMDKRTPVPLLPMMANHQKANMRDHLLAVQEIVVALATDDFAAVEKAAGRIGYSEQMGQMCNHMGMGAPGFSDKAVGFHRAADKITAAARDRDKGRVLTELGTTLGTCTSCHATWKQQVVDEASWTKATSAPVPSPAMHH